VAARRGRHLRVLVAGVGVLALLRAPVSIAASTYRAHDDASLRAAVTNANASPGPSTIELNGTTFRPSSTLTLTGEVTITGPATLPGAKLDGGAVSPVPSDLLAVDAHAKLVLRNVLMTTAGGAGGAAAIDDFGEVDLESSTVAGNNGPGLLVERGASATVRNSTLSDGLDVGLIDLGTASLFNATVAANANGGVDDGGGTLKLTNTIIARNGSPDCTRRASASDHSLDGDGSCGVGALARADPRLQKLAMNGGPTPTRALAPGSPAIDAGDPSVCPAEDQRHFARREGRCDIGAYQTDAVPPAGAPPGSGPGGGIGSGVAAGGVFVGVSGRGALRGALRSRISFALRALRGRSNASFSYVDRTARVALRSLRVRSLAIDGQTGVATLRGSCLQAARRRRVTVTLVLTSHAGRRSLRIRLSSGYYKAGRLLSGSITFIRSQGRAAQLARAAAVHLNGWPWGLANAPAPW
jgi:hypothetical protein